MDKGKALAARYFKLTDSSTHKWTCSCGKVLTAAKGYSNLVSHIKSQHPDYAKLPTEQLSIAFSNPSKKATNIYSWLRWVCLDLKPFEFVEQPLTREFTKLDPITVNTLKKYMDLVTKKVEEKISSLLPDRFALIINGWTKTSTHFIGLFASIPYDNENGYKTVLLAFSPLHSETSFTARDHFDFITYVLCLYQKNLCNVVALTADNCKTMKALSNLMNVPLIGCASHRFNLSVMQLIKAEEEGVKKVNALMGKLKNLKLAGQLRKLTELKPIQKNDTRWSSTGDMLKRYLELKVFISDPSISRDPAVLDYIPSAREEADLLILQEKLQKLNSVTLQLQANAIDLSDVRFLFDSISEEFPIVGEYCNPNARIVHSPEFEKAVVTVLEGKERQLSESQKVLMSSILKDTSAPVVDEEATTSYAAGIMKKRRLEKNTSNSAYMDCRFLLPTSNVVERFFSTAGFAYGDLRQRILPLNLEMQLFLKLNCDLWDSELVNDCL